MPIDYKRKCGIYCITNPSGKTYIGQSVNIDDRLNRYKRLKNCEEQHLLFNSLKKYGPENHKFEIIEICDEKSLTKKEQEYMQLFLSLDRKFGLNIREAGPKGSHSIETKIKISIANTGKIRGPEAIKNMSIAQRKNPTRYWLGKKRSDADKEKFRKSHLGMVTSNKPIIQFDLNTNEIQRFDGATDAARKLGIKRSSIKNCLRGYSEKYFNSRWKYVSM